MSIELNHTIIWCRDKQVSAKFFTDLFGLPAAKPFGPMLVVALSNRVSIDFYDNPEGFSQQHYAFLISEPEFDAIFARVKARELPYWADPHKNQPGAINHHDGGRGVYFEDPDGHFLEIITKPYGG